MKLSTTLCLYVLCMCMAIFGVTSFALEHFLTKNKISEAHRFTELIQEQIIDNVKSKLQSVEQSTQRTQQHINNMVDPSNTRMGKQLIEMMLSDSLIANAYIAQRLSSDSVSQHMLDALRQKGTVIVYERDPKSYSYLDRFWYTAPLKSLSPVWSRPYLNFDDNDDLVITYSTPLYDASKRPFAVLAADVSIKTLSNEIFKLIPYDETSSFLLTDDGVLLDYSSKNNKIDTWLPDFINSVNTTAGRKEIHEGMLTINGEQYITCCSRIASAHISVVTMTPYTSILSVIPGVQKNLAYILLAGFILVVLGIRIVLHFAVRPIDRLTQNAVDIGNGNFDTKFSSKRVYSDITTLQNALKQMAASIKQYVSEIAENTQKQQRINSELEIARNIQNSMLPVDASKDHTLIEKGICIGALLEAATGVGGDLYDYVCKDNRLYFAVADVSGKGTPAALVMASVRSVFHFAAEMSLSPAEILSRINHNLSDNNTENIFVTMQVGCIDLTERVLTLANAGHNPPVMIKDKIATLLTLPAALPLGVFADTNYSEQTMDYSPDEMLFMYTDGLTEAEDNQRMQYGDCRLINDINQMIASGISDPRIIVAGMRKIIGSFSKVNLEDDITMLCIGVKDENTAVSKLALKHKVEENARLSEFITDFAQRHHIAGDTLFKTELVAEEVLTNITTHSRPSRSDSTIEVSLSKSNNILELSFEDTGEPFNMLDTPSVNVDLPIEERPVGGLGIHLVKKNVDKAHYGRLKGRNILILQINL